MTTAKTTQKKKRGRPARQTRKPQIIKMPPKVDNTCKVCGSDDWLANGTPNSKSYVSSGIAVKYWYCRECRNTGRSEVDIPIGYEKKEPESFFNGDEKIKQNRCKIQ